MKWNMIFTDGLVPFGMAASPTFDANEESADSIMDNNTIFNDIEAKQ
jgi:hypothetical protein